MSYPSFFRNLGFLGCTDAEHFRTAGRASPLGGWFSVFHLDRLRRLDGFLRLAFYAITLYHYTLLFVYLIFTIYNLKREVNT